MESAADSVKEFAKNSVRLVKRCQKPDRKEFGKVARLTAMGFVAVGLIGFAVKVIFIPINQGRRVVVSSSGGDAAGGGGGGGEDAAAPQLMGDWRAFRAKLVAQSSGDGGWAARQAEQNLVLLEMQNPALAREECWAHATGAPEIGGLVVATSRAPEVLGEEYWQAVVLIVNHGPQGTIGLILNRPTALKMKRGRGGLPLAVDGMESLRDAFAESRIYCGGFNAQQIVTLLHGQRRLEGALEIVPGIYIGGQAAASAEVLTGGLKHTDFRFFMGVCAWQPGELAGQVAAGAWHTAACSRSLVLKQCLQLPTPLWREVMALMGGEYAEEARAAQRADDGSDDDD